MALAARAGCEVDLLHGRELAVGRKLGESLDLASARGAHRTGAAPAGLHLREHVGLGEREDPHHPLQARRHLRSSAARTTGHIGIDEKPPVAISGNAAIGLSQVAENHFTAAVTCSGEHVIGEGGFPDERIFYRGCRTKEDEAPTGFRFRELLYACRDAPLGRELVLPDLGLGGQAGNGGKPAVLILLIGTMQRRALVVGAPCSARPVRVACARPVRVVHAVPQLSRTPHAGDEIVSGKNALHAYSVGLTRS